MGLGRTNSSSAQLISPSNALLHIFAAVNSTITISKNGIVIKELDSSKGHISSRNSQVAEYYYPISSSNYGIWSITANTNAEITKSIEVTTNMVYEVDITALYLYNYGEYISIYDHIMVRRNTTITDKTDYISIVGSGNSAQDGYIVWKNVDLTYFNTITLIRASNDSRDRYVQISVVSTASPGHADIRNSAIESVSQITSAVGSKTTRTLNISNITGTWSVAVGYNTNNASWTYGRREFVYSVKLS